MPGGSAKVGANAIADALAAAAPGALLEAQLFPLNRLGRLRLTYNWLYSALNCDPNDSSPFAWIVQKSGSNSVTLSPGAQYGGMTLFASVRPDWNYVVQVQAPYSADWITAAGADEQLTMTDLGLRVINLQGLNGQYLSVNPEATSHDDHTGYLLQSNASTPSAATDFFLGVTQTLQSAVRVPLASDLRPEDVRAALAAREVSSVDELSESIVKAIG